MICLLIDFQWCNAGKIYFNVIELKEFDKEPRVAQRVWVSGGKESVHKVNLPHSHLSSDQVKEKVHFSGRHSTCLLSLPLEWNRLQTSELCSRMKYIKIYIFTDKSWATFADLFVNYGLMIVTINKSWQCRFLNFGRSWSMSFTWPFHMLVHERDQWTIRVNPFSLWRLA